jgi:hypothetical protein
MQLEEAWYSIDFRGGEHAWHSKLSHFTFLNACGGYSISSLLLDLAKHFEKVILCLCMIVNYCRYKFIDTKLITLQISCTVSDIIFLVLLNIHCIENVWNESCRPVWNWYFVAHFWENQQYTWSSGMFCHVALDSNVSEKSVWQNFFWILHTDVQSILIF